MKWTTAVWILGLATAAVFVKSLFYMQRPGGALVVVGIFVFQVGIFAWLFRLEGSRKSPDDQPRP